MRFLFLACVTAFVVNAQGFNGVSIGGTPAAPVIVNHSRQAIYGYGIKRLTSNGVNHTFSVFSSTQIVQGHPIGPGEEHAPGLFLGIISNGFDPVTKKEIPEGDVVGYTLTGVLFADGTFLGDDRGYEDLSEMLYMARSYARDMQYQGDKENALRRDAESATPPRGGSGAEWQHRKTLATLFLGEGLKGRDERDRAIARVAALPDVRRGR
jgi:hypothetical protein